MKTTKLPTNAKEVKELDLEDSSLYKLSKSSGYVAALEETLEGVDQEDKDQLYMEFKEACITQLKYLQSHLPFDRPLIMAATFADPKKRNLGSLPDLAVSAANELKRFTAAEVTKVRVQAQSYQALPSHLVPEFDSMEDRVDQWWTKIFKVLEEQMSEPPMELIRLVKFLLILPHGQATVTKEVLAKYKADMEKEQEEKRKAEEKEQEEKRKAEENAKGEADAKKPKPKN